MNKKIIGSAVSMIVIAFMVFITIKTIISSNEKANENEEYPSAMIEDLPDELIDRNLEYDTGLEKGNQAPDFELTTLAGDTVKLTDYKGKKVILNFWASWCPPCRVEMPFMEDYYQSFKEQDNVEILAVNMTSQERGQSEKVKEFVEEHNLTFPILLDKEGDVLDLYKVMVYPTTFIISTEGTITDIVQTSLDDHYLKELVDNSH